jgi:hypothetical protein
MIKIIGGINQDVMLTGCGQHIHPGGKLSPSNATTEGDPSGCSIRYRFRYGYH